MTNPILNTHLRSYHLRDQLNQVGENFTLMDWVALVDGHWSVVCGWSSSDISRLCRLAENEPTVLECVLLALRNANVSAKKDMHTKRTSYTIVQNDVIRTMVLNKNDTMLAQHAPFVHRHMAGLADSPEIIGLIVQAGMERSVSAWRALGTDDNLVADVRHIEPLTRSYVSNLGFSNSPNIQDTTLAHQRTFDLLERLGVDFGTWAGNDAILKRAVECYVRDSGWLLTLVMKHRTDLPTWVFEAAGGNDRGAQAAVALAQMHADKKALQQAIQPSDMHTRSARRM